MYSTPQQDVPGKRLPFLLQVLSFCLALLIVIAAPAQVLTNGTLYQIKCKGSQRVLDVRGGSDAPGTQVWQYDRNLTTAQRFTFGDGGNGSYMIFTKANLLVSIKVNLMVSEANVNNNSNSSGIGLVQDKPYVAGRLTAVAVNAPDPNRQKWKLIPAGDNFTFFIQSVAYPDKVLQPFNNDAQASLVLAPNTGADIQKWIINEPDDMMNEAMASPGEINELKDILTYQLGVGVLGGESTRPFYYHNNQPGETVYKYKKLIDPAKLPGELIDMIKNKLGPLGFVLSPVSEVLDLASDVKDFFTGSGSTKMYMDCWYPDSELRRVVCGKMKDKTGLCTQDYLHTQVTQDKDANFDIVPNDKFTFMLKNRWIGDKFDKIECEVRPTAGDPLYPRNPQVYSIKKDENACMYGPWMGDILDINAKIPIPLTDTKIEVANIDLRNNNEIHPVNQFWVKRGQELDLTSIVDGTGYFQKTGNNEIQASGLNQAMRYYIAFEVPATNTPRTSVMGISPLREFDVNGVGFDFSNNAAADIQPQTLTLKYKGVVRIKVNDNSFVRFQHTHHIFFDKMRVRPDGSAQGYIVVETDPIVKQGGSINIFVKETTPQGNNTVPTRLPVRQ